IILLTLVLGLGVNTAIFSIINIIYLCVLFYPEPDRLMHVSEFNAQWSDMSVSLPNFLDWLAQQDVFASLAIYHTDGRKIQTRDGVEQVALGHVSGDFFRALGARVRHGRELTAEDDRVGAAPVTWLTHEAWQRYFSGSEDLVGRTIGIDGQQVTVAGILAADFRFFRHVDVLVPLAPYAEHMFMNERENHNGTQVIGRLKPGITLSAARAQMEAIGQRLQEAHPQVNTGIGVRVVPLRASTSPATRAPASFCFWARSGWYC
ncbi:MAG TPA: ABC transporter permease, partial [Opitutaceae bacterium]